MTTTTDARATAFKAALSGIGAPVYDADEIPTTVPNEWAEVGLSRTAGGNGRLNGASATSNHYLTVGVGGRTVSNVRKRLDAVRDALEGRMVAVGDTATTPLRFYAETQVEYIKELGAGRYWQIATYAYAI